MPKNDHFETSQNSIWSKVIMGGPQVGSMESVSSGKYWCQASKFGQLIQGNPLVLNLVLLIDLSSIAIIGKHWIQLEQNCIFLVELLLALKKGILSLRMCLAPIFVIQKLHHYLPYHFTTSKYILQRLRNATLPYSFTLNQWMLQIYPLFICWSTKILN